MTQPTRLRPPALSISASLRLPLIENWLDAIQPESVLEVGAGVGAMGYRLASRYEYRGYEPDPTSHQIAASRLAVLGRGKIVNTEIPDEPDRRFDLVVAFEVLEHIELDVRALTGWSHWLTEGGHVVMSMPAHPDRFGPWDERVGHYRRYSRKSLDAVFDAAGFEVRSIQSWGMPLGYLLEAARNGLAKRRLGDTGVGTAGSGRVYQPPAGLGRAVEVAMRPVAALQRPFTAGEKGIGYVAVGRLRKPLP